MVEPTASYTNWDFEKSHPLQYSLVAFVSRMNDDDAISILKNAFNFAMANKSGEVEHPEHGMRLLKHRWCKL